MSLLFKNHFHLARDYIRHHRSRSILTCIGIAVGVASIILILSLMGSISNLIKSEIKTESSNLIVVRPSNSKPLTDSIIEELISTSSYTKSNLSLNDVDIISAIQNVQSVAPVAISVASLKGAGSLDSAPVLATTPDFQALENLTLEAGVFLNNSNSENTGVIGHDLATRLFGTLAPIGQTVSLFGENVLIVGVLTEQNLPMNFNNIDLDSALIVNTTFFTRHNISLQIQQINIKVAESYSIGATAENIKDKLLETKHGENNFSVLYGDQITHPAGSLLSTITGILSLVAGISLIVGGIGVMNIMLVSVAERSHEIGVRKAVGASNQNILLEFLLESLILCFIGGIMGLALGYTLAFFVSLVTPFAPFISPEIVGITFLTTFIVGIFFGLYPALKAARKSPIFSLQTYH